MKTARDTSTLSGRIMVLLEKEDISRQKFADSVGVSAASVGQWIRGERGPTNGTLVQIADYYGVTVDWLLARTPLDDEQEPKKQPETAAAEQIFADPAGHLVRMNSVDLECIRALYGMVTEIASLRERVGRLEELAAGHASQLPAGSAGTAGGEGTPET